MAWYRLFAVSGTDPSVMFFGLWAAQSLPANNSYIPLLLSLISDMSPRRIPRNTAPNKTKRQSLLCWESCDSVEFSPVDRMRIVWSTAGKSVPTPAEKERWDVRRWFLCFAILWCIVGCFPEQLTISRVFPLGSNVRADTQSRPRAHVTLAYVSLVWPWAHPRALLFPFPSWRRLVQKSAGCGVENAPDRGCTT